VTLNNKINESRDLAETAKPMVKRLGRRTAR
jgi:hypothetical protein